MKDKIKPIIECVYKAYSVYGVPYCSVSQLDVDCPYLSSEKIKEKCYSAVTGDSELEFKVCNFEFENGKRD